MPLIEIEGLDGSGKETQVILLNEALRELGYDTKTVSYPVYDESGYMIKEYLNGKYGNDLTKLNPYTISLFYTTNRVNDYLKNWKNNYDDGDVIIADRYTGSNLIHQSLLADNPKEYMEWLYSIENDYCKLPKADIVVYLDTEAEQCRDAMKNRESTDKLENLTEYAEKCRQFVLNNHKAWNWHIVPRDTIEKVHNRILEIVLPRLIYTKEDSPQIK